MTKGWELAAFTIGVAALLGAANLLRPMIGVQEIRLTEQELVRVDAVSGKSQACTTHEQRERCVTVSETDGRFMPHLSPEVRELGVRDVVRARLRGE